MNRANRFLAGLSVLGVIGLALARSAAIAEETTDMKFDFQDGPLPRTQLKVELAPEKSVVKSNRALVLLLEINNGGKKTITTTLAHEWHGGLWPTTFLHASVTPAGSKDRKAFLPVYLLGEDQNLTKPTIIEPGKNAKVGLRMNWPGTGSVKGDPLINTPGKYVVQFALVLDADGKRQYALSSPTEVEYKAE